MNSPETQKIYSVLKTFSESTSGLNSVADISKKYDKETIDVIVDGLKTYLSIIKSYLSDMKAHGEDVSKVELIVAGLSNLKDYLDKINNLNLLTHAETVAVIQYVTDQAYLIRRLFREYVLN